MAKFGPKDKSGYDPFNAISQTLTALKEEDQAPAPVVQVPPSFPSRREQPPEPRPTVQPQRPAVEKPPVAQEPRPSVQFPRNNREPSDRSAPAATTESSGGGAAEAVRQARTVSSASALRTTKRFKTTIGEAQKHDQAVVRLAGRLGMSIDFSKITRALWEIYLQHEEDILKNVPSDETWKRPRNNDAVGLAELDERIAQLIGDGFMVAAMRPKNRR